MTRKRCLVLTVAPRRPRCYTGDTAQGRKRACKALHPVPRPQSHLDDLVIFADLGFGRLRVLLGVLHFLVQVLDYLPLLHRGAVAGFKGDADARARSCTAPPTNILHDECQPNLPMSTSTI